MPKFCIHERHAGICEKTGSYCNEGACPYKDMRDFAEVVHGRWKGSGPLLECQCCGEIYSKLGGNAGKLWNYCPNCGAKMDKEESNGR